METLRDSSELKEAADILGEELVVRLRDQRSSREDKLRHKIRELAQRSRSRIVVLSDDQGLPLVAQGDAIDSERVSAAVTLLGDTLSRVGRIVGRPDAHYVALELSFDERLVVLQFEVQERTYYLFSIGPSDVDIRSELELSIMQVDSILSV